MVQKVCLYSEVTSLVDSNESLHDRVSPFVTCYTQHTAMRQIAENLFNSNVEL